MSDKIQQWKVGDVISASKMNAMVDAINNLLSNETGGNDAVYITHDELNDILKQYSDVGHTHSIDEIVDLVLPTKLSQLENDIYYATEDYVTNAIANAQIGGDGEVDLSAYATKNYVDGEIAKVQLSGGVIDEEPSNVVDLVIFMGQSNMAGRGVAAEAPKVPSGHGYEFRAISDPTRLYDIIEPFGVNENNSTSGVTETTKTGSMVSAFVNEYYKRTMVPIVGVSCSKGGTRSTYWNPDTDALNDAIERHNAARTWLESNGYVVRRDFMVWCQGETDGDLAITGTVWENSVASIISEMKNKTLVECCMVVRIGNHRDDSTKYDTIIRATNSLCLNNPSAILVSTCLASFAKKGLMSDKFHYTQEGYNLVGEEAGKYSAYYINENREPMIYDPEYNDYYTPNTDSNISAQFTRMENTILALEARIAALEGEPLSSYTVTINPTPNNATVKINYIEQTSITVTEGTRINWVVSLDGYETKSGSLIVASNQTLDITLTTIDSPEEPEEPEQPDQSDTTVLEFNFDSQTENGVDLSAYGTISDGNIYVNKTKAELASPVNVSPNESFTIEVIAKADLTVEGLTDWATGVVLSSGAATSGYLQLPYATNKTLQFSDRAMATTAKGACSSIDTSVKNHFAVVYDANAKEILMYANGKSLTVSYTKGSASTLTAFDFTHILGGVFSSNKDFGYVGNIYYLRVSNTALLPENFHIE